MFSIQNLKSRALDWGHSDVRGRVCFLLEVPLLSWLCRCPCAREALQTGVESCAVTLAEVRLCARQGGSPCGDCRGPAWTVSLG